jgi:hypothetical protein
MTRNGRALHFAPNCLNMHEDKQLLCRHVDVPSVLSEENTSRDWSERSSDAALIYDYDYEMRCGTPMLYIASSLTSYHRRNSQHKP